MRGAASPSDRLERVAPPPGNRPNVARMFKQIHSMPPGTVGFEAVGEIDDDDFEDVVAPVLRQQIASGHKLRLLYLLGPQLREYEGDAAQEQLKFAARHITAYERVCVVSDESWLGPALRILSVLVPGTIRGFPVADLDAAKRWVADGLDRGGEPTPG
jgi:SpoIIAA-like